MTLLIKNNEAQSFQIDEATKIKRYNVALSSYDIVEIKVDGNHGKVMNKKSNKTYYITSGKGVFAIDEKSHTVEVGDVISVEANSWLNIQGNKLSALIITTPPFNADDEVWR